MKILLLGNGGREHALAWKIAQSPLCTQLYTAPGNPGTAQHGQNVSLSLTDFARIAHFVLDEGVEMVVVGPELPLVRGIRDFFLSSERLKDIPVVGPDQKGAQLEGSKDFAKQFMKRHGILTAEYAAFSKETLRQARDYLAQAQAPYVLKADGLAAGKGVIITSDILEAEKTIEEMLLHQKFGEASRKVVVEQFLEGIELSVFVLTDGKNYLILPEAKDYKRIGEGDTGPNTGGMGAVSPVPFADKAFMQRVEQEVIRPTIQGLHKEGIDYKGFIFFGLMNVAGKPYVIEYNVRLGDPEAQVVLPRLQTDLVALFKAVMQEDLPSVALEIRPEYATTVVLVSGGYPEAYEKGKQITSIAPSAEVMAFQAGTCLDPDTSALLTDGGRVMALTSLSTSLAEGIQMSQRAANQVHFEGKYHRRDIGQDLLAFLPQTS
ncbi:MAG: phosphoribosylamine--glycine ligase [Microscillaceae bacterium]